MEDEDVNGNNGGLEQFPPPPPVKKKKLAYASVHEEFEIVPSLFNAR